MTAVFAALTAAVVAGWLRRRHVVVTVAGDSMAPTYRDGERLLVRRRRLGGVPRGAPVLVRLPPPAADPADAGSAGVGAAGEVLMVKRVAALPGDPVPTGVPGPDPVVPPSRLVVIGDNPHGSHDSRAVGCVRSGALVGVVVRRMG
jgi:signal peptidase I